MNPERQHLNVAKLMIHDIASLAVRMTSLEGRGLPREERAELPLSTTFFSPLKGENLV